MASARTAALRLLGRRDYTTSELRTKLLDRDFAADAVDETLAALAADGFVDDRRAAAAHVRTASRIKSRGRLRIQRELEARGIARDVIHEALEALPPSDERAALDTFLQRRRLPPRLTQQDRRRLFQQLMRRGFSADVIAKAIKDREET